VVCWTVFQLAHWAVYSEALMVTFLSYESDWKTLLMMMKQLALLARR
jgi:hypothetical protein